MCGCKSWTIKKAECPRIDAFELWCWRRLLRAPWTASGSDQSILKETSPDYLLEWLMLKLKLQYFGHLMWRTDSFEKTLMLGKTKGRRRRGHRGWDGWMASLTWQIWVWASSGSWCWTGKPGMLQSMGSQCVRHDWVTEQQLESLEPSTIILTYSFQKLCICWRKLLIFSHGIFHILDLAACTIRVQFKILLCSLSFLEIGHNEVQRLDSILLQLWLLLRILNRWCRTVPNASH